MEQLYNTYSDLLLTLGAALQLRNSMSAQYRCNPTISNREWRDEANQVVRTLRRRERRLAKQLAA
jgi:hypothetical protein